MPALPDPDFIAVISKGARHQELIRAKLGPQQYKNFENLCRGANTPSSTTVGLLATTLDIDRATLRGLEATAGPNHLLPSYVAAFEAAESTFLVAFRSSVGSVKCSCCGKSLNDRTTEWWDSQPIPLTLGAAAFVDRLLTATMGAALALECLEALGAQKGLNRGIVVDLANPSTHPIGHWIELVQRTRSEKFAWKLTTKDCNGMDVEPALPGRILKWRSGVDLLPFDRAEGMIFGASHYRLLSHANVAARTVALAVDVLQACALSGARPSRKVAQQIVSDRLHYFNAYTTLALGAQRPS